jgi:hypothetical protein
MLTRKLNKAGEQLTPTMVALEEARAIDALQPAYQGQPMRLHTVGDCATNMAAKIVSAAAERWMARGGGQVWTYTHAWREVDRMSWGQVSVLASCETPIDVELARSRGYASAIVVDEFEGEKRYALGTAMVIPCPAQTHGSPCTSCKLCFNDYRLRSNKLTIGFHVHGDNSSIRLARGSLKGARPARLRESIPVLLEQGLSGAEIARRTDTNPSSVYEMIGRLRKEGVVT